MKEIQYEGCRMTDAKWRALFNSMIEERVVLVIGDGFISVGNTTLDNHIKIQILKKHRISSTSRITKNSKSSANVPAP